MQHFEDEVHADLLKTAEDVSKEAAPWKQKLLAPALGLGMALAPGAKAQQPTSQQTVQEGQKSGSPTSGTVRRISKGVEDHWYVFANDGTVFSIWSNDKQGLADGDKIEFETKHRFGTQPGLFFLHVSDSKKSGGKPVVLEVHKMNPEKVVKEDIPPTPAPVQQTPVQQAPARQLTGQAFIEALNEAFKASGSTSHATLNYFVDGSAVSLHSQKANSEMFQQLINTEKQTDSMRKAGFKYLVYTNDKDQNFQFDLATNTDLSTQYQEGQNALKERQEQSKKLNEELNKDEQATQLFSEGQDLYQKFRQDKNRRTGDAAIQALQKYIEFTGPEGLFVDTAKNYIAATKSALIVRPVPVVKSTKSPNWGVDQKKDEMGDQHLTFMASSSSGGQTLILRFSNNKLEIYISAGHEFLTDHAQQVRVKFDDAAPTKQSWAGSEGGTALFSGNPYVLLEKIRASQKFIIEYSPYERTPEIASFNVAGLSDVLEMKQPGTK